MVITANRWKAIPWDRIVTKIEEGLYAADVSFAKENTRKLCDHEYSNQSTSSWLKHAWSFLKGKRFIQSRESSFRHNLSYTWNKCTKRAFCDLLAVRPFFLCWSMRCTACFDVAHTPQATAKTKLYQSHLTKRTLWTNKFESDSTSATQNKSSSWFYSIKLWTFWLKINACSSPSGGVFLSMLAPVASQDYSCPWPYSHSLPSP